MKKHEAWVEAERLVKQDGQERMVLRTGASPGPFDYEVVENLDRAASSDLILGNVNHEGEVTKLVEPVFVRAIFSVE